jgi:hypothetical protein
VSELHQQCFVALAGAVGVLAWASLAVLLQHLEG